MFYGGLILLIFIIIIVDCLKDIRALFIPARKQTIEIVFLVIVSMVIMGITYLYAKIWFHYILGILGAVYLILNWARKGITPKGFNSVNSFGSYGNWNKLKAVQVSVENNVKVSFITSHSENIHYYKKEDYDRIITLLLKQLPSQILKIR